MNDDLIIKSEEQNINLADENSSLKAELEALKASIENARKMDAQTKELSDLFPSVSEDDIPSDVYEYVKTHGGTLAGAYAVYHRREQLKKDRADQKALENILKTPGAAKGAANGVIERLFTADEIRSMNREQVRRNYKQIMKSLKYGK